jgi:hypothetical protein
MIVFPTVVSTLGARELPAVEPSSLERPTSGFCEITNLHWYSRRLRRLVIVGKEYIHAVYPLSWSIQRTTCKQPRKISPRFCPLMLARV